MNPSINMYNDIFMSYAWSDGKDYAIRLQAALESSGFRVWRDPKIRKSADFTAEIEIAIRACKLVVVVMTHRIEDNPDNYVRREVAYAEILEKPVIVARFDDAIILPLTTRTWLEFWNSAWDTRFPQLVEVLHKEIDLVDAGIYLPPDLPAALKNDPYRRLAIESYELATSLIEQTTIFKQEIDLIAKPDLKRIGKTMPRSSALRQAFKRMDAIDTSQFDKAELTSLAEAMVEYGGRVLLLGEPGAGKTTSLMALARDLASARMGDPTAPLPIFAFCSRWTASPPQLIYDWLGNENNILANDMNRMILEGDVVLLLDGLDELGSSQTEKTITKDIDGKDKEVEVPFDPRKRFIEHISDHGNFVISTRIEDYENIGDKLITLNGAITLQNLTDDQLQDYLLDMPLLWEILIAEPELLKLARTPLLLSLFAYGFREAPETAQQLKDLTGHELRNAIFQTYINKRYDHEQRRLAAMGQESPFSLEEIYEVLGHVAMINASGGMRIGGGFRDWGIIQDNVFLERDIAEQLDIKNIQSFIQYCSHLNLMIAIEDELRFIHLRLRDMLVSNYCKNHLYDEKLYTSPFFPNPAKAISNLPYQEGFTFCMTLLETSESEMIQQSALVGLGNIDSQQARDILIYYLKHDENPNVRWAAISGMWKLADDRVLDALYYALRHDIDWEVRDKIAELLGIIGSVNKQALDALIYALNYDDEVEVRQTVVTALTRGGDKARKALIRALYEDDDWDVRELIAQDFADIGDKQAITALIEVMQDNDELKDFVFNLLLNISDERGLKIILGSPYELGTYAGDELKAETAKKLEEIGTPTALAAVRKWRES